MNSRDSAATAAADDAVVAEPVDAPFVDPAQVPASIADRRRALATAYAACAAAAQTCVGHCQRRLAAGDTNLADCLRTALDCDAIATAVARLARNRSAWGPVVAKQSISMLDACVEACRPHRDHHPECRACFDACGKAIAATRAA